MHNKNTIWPTSRSYLSKIEPSDLVERSYYVIFLELTSGLSWTFIFINLQMYKGAGGGGGGGGGGGEGCI